MRPCLSKKKCYHTTDSRGICKALSKPGTEKGETGAKQGQSRGGAGQSRGGAGLEKGRAQDLLVRTEPVRSLEQNVITKVSSSGNLVSKLLTNFIELIFFPQLK